MSEGDDTIADSQWRAEFRDRLVEARGPRSQKVMAELLHISHDAYRKYESSRKSMMSPRHFPLLCKIAGKSLEWLLTGKEKADKPAKSVPKRRKRAA